MSGDLGGTTGWRLTGHARQAAACRGFSIHEVLLAVAFPEVRYTAYDHGQDREVRQRDDLAAAVHEPSRTVITVLWRCIDQWTDQQARQARFKSVQEAQRPVLGPRNTIMIGTGV